MGHSSSKEQQPQPQPQLQSQGRHTYKLSKPRITNSISPPSAQPTGAPSTAPLTTSRIPPARPVRSPDPAPDLLISIPYSATASSSIESPEDDRKESQPIPDRSSSFRSPPKPQRRLSLFRSKSSQERADLHKSRRNTIIGTPVVSPEEGFVAASGAVGRTHSLSTYHPAHELHVEAGLSVTLNHPHFGNRPTSWAYDLSSYEAQRILNLVQDPIPQLHWTQTLPPTSETQVNEMQQTATWRRRPSVTVQPESAPISRTQSEVSLHPPMRRRSMIQTPGVATRTRPSHVPTRSTKSSIRHSHPPSPNMSRQTSMEAIDGVLSLAPMPAAIRVTGDTQRVQTPKETDYCATGAFKFGTLRITNGSPIQTPAPAEILKTELKSKATGPSEDYFAATPAAGAVLSNRTVQVQDTSATQHGKPQASGPAMQESTAPKPKIATEAPDFPHISLTIPNLELGVPYASELQTNLDHVPEKPLPSPLKTQSKTAAVDDDLFITDDDDDPEISTVEVLDVRLDLNAKGLPPRPIDETVVVAPGVRRTDSGFVSNSKSDSSQSRSSLAKADSGYSSNVSLRSLHSGRKSLRADQEAARSSVDSDSDSSRLQRIVSPKGLAIKIPEVSAGGDDAPTETPQSEKAPTPPPKDNPPNQQAGFPPNNNAGAEGKRAAPMSPGKLRKKPSQVRSPATDTNQSSDAEPTNTSPSTHSPLTATNESKSSLSIGNVSQKPGRLSRLLSLKGSPFSKQSYTVHITHAVDSQIPSIPKEVEDKLREHTGLFPMTTKRLALRSQLSKETLKTILSVGSLEMAKDDDLPRTPTFFDKEEDEVEADTDSSDGKERSLKNSFNAMQSNLKSAAASMMSGRSSVVRKPVPVRQEPQKTVTTRVLQEDKMLTAKATLTSHHSVNSSMENKSYNVATKANASPVRPARSLSAAAERTQPLQLRTYSLHGDSPTKDTPLSSADQIRSTSPKVNDLREKRRSSPPVSMATRAGFRAPPPRSPLRPQGPVVQREERMANITGSTTTASRGPSAGRLVNHRASIDSLYGRTWVTPAQQQPTNSFRCNSLSSQRPPSASIGFNQLSSTSSVQCEAIRGTENVQMQLHGQVTHGSGPKHMEIYGRVQSRGVYVPQPAHQGTSASWPYGAQTQQWDPQHNTCIIDNRASWNQTAPSVPYVPRGHHRRNLSAGSRPYYQMNGGQPPYRILHSYNSPAYRNAPIWG